MPIQDLINNPELLMLALADPQGASMQLAQQGTVLGDSDAAELLTVIANQGTQPAGVSPQQGQPGQPQQTGQPPVSAPTPTPPPSAPPAPAPAPGGGLYNIGAILSALGSATSLPSPGLAPAIAPRTGNYSPTMSIADLLSLVASPQQQGQQQGQQQVAPPGLGAILAGV